MVQSETLAHPACQCRVVSECSGVRPLVCDTQAERVAEFAHPLGAVGGGALGIGASAVGAFILQFY